MSVIVFPLRLGITSCYLIRDRGTILVDAGSPGLERAFGQRLARAGINAADLGLIVLTHGHFDHAGSAVGISKLAGAQVAAHRNEVDSSTGRIKSAPPTPRTGWGSAMWGLIGPLAARVVGRAEAPTADVIVEDDGLSLGDYGVAGRIVYTPGHTAGSLSVVLDNGDAFVGCLSHNGPPFRMVPDLPIFADDPDGVLRSWDDLLKRGIRRVYPGHGAPFAVEEIIPKLRAGRWPTR